MTRMLIRGLQFMLVAAAVVVVYATGWQYTAFIFGGCVGALFCVIRDLIGDPSHDETCRRLRARLGIIARE
jgi:hypothetical protein